MPYDYVNFSCVLSNSPGLYASLTECENAVNDGSAKPVLRLSPLWNASKRVSLPLTTSKLGDGYQQTVFQGVDQVNEEWDITSPIMSESQVNQLLNQLRRLSASSFLWSPNNGIIPYQEFTCDEWRKTRVGINQYQVTTKFKMTILGSGLLIEQIVPPAPSIVSPLEILGADLIAWYRGDSALSDGSQWNDLSGNNNHTLVQSNSNLRPSYQSTGFNNKPCLDFLNSRWFQLPNFLQSSWGQASLIILYDLNSRNSHWSAMQTGSGSDPYWGTTSTFAFNSYVGEFRANRIVNNPGPDVINVVGQGALIITTGVLGYRIFRNGNTTPAYTSTANWGVTSTPYIGRDGLGSKFMNGKIAEIGIARKEISASEIASIFSYLKSFWNLTIY